MLRWLALVVGVGAVLGAALTPGEGSQLKPVAGGVVQEFRASAVVHAAADQPKRHRDYFFSGGPTDLLAPLGAATPAFSTAAPSGSTPNVQVGVPIANVATGTVGAIYWRAPLAAKIAGPMTISWWWATEDALASGTMNADVSIIADPGTAKQKTIGAKTISIGNLGPMPSKLVTSLYVDGASARELAVVVDPVYADASEDLRVYYGSADYPSGFSLPLGITARAKVPSNVALAVPHPLVGTSSYIGRKSAEPTIGITKAGNAFVTAADFDGLSPATPRTQIYASYTGDRSWRNVSPTTPVTGSYPPTTLDPYLYVDPTTGRIFSDDLTVGCSVLLWSDDQGKTWTRGNPLACDGPADDHQTLVAGPPPQGVTTNGYPNVLYYCVNKVAGSECARSLDGGNTFMASGTPVYTGVDPANSGARVCGGLHGHVVADRVGRIYVPKGHCGKPWLAVSEDAGQTWRRTVVSQTIGVGGGQASVAVDTSGAVYYVWWDDIDHLPYLAVSHDAGKTFGPALMIAPPGVKEVNFPTISAGRRGQIAVSFPGTTSAKVASAARPWNYYVLTSDDALSARPLFRSMTANPVSDPIHRGVCQNRCSGMYDFLDIQIAPNGDVWAVGVDTCTHLCSTAQKQTLKATEQPNDAQGLVTRVLAKSAWTKQTR